jgi:pimeloyl-ACP methyl ester carboxylesterase
MARDTWSVVGRAFSRPGAVLSIGGALFLGLVPTSYSPCPGSGQRTLTPTAYEKEPTQMSSAIQVRSSDTVLAGTDAGGGQPAVLFLNGAFGTQRDWARTISGLGDRYRIVTFDARGRGRSPRAPRYSFAADLEDLSAVIEATHLDQPILVGWSHGAALAVRYAAAHPGRVKGLVLADGAFPMPAPTAADQDKARRMFRYLGPLMAIMAAFGRSAKVSGSQAAEMNIDLRVALSTIGPDYDAISCPVDFIVGSKPHTGSTDADCRAMRATVPPLAEAHPNLVHYSTLEASHTELLSRFPGTIVDAIDDVAMKAAISSHERPKAG